MTWTGLKRTVRRLLSRDLVETELDEEIRSYLAEDIAQKIEAGMTPDAARREALIELGGAEQLKETVRDTRRMAWLDGILADLRYAFRSLRKRPAFSILAIVVLSLGIGAATAVFSVVDKVLLKPLPYRDANRLVSVLATVPKWRQDPMMAKVWNQFTISYTQYRELQKPESPFEDIAIFQASGNEAVHGSDGPRRIPVGVAPAHLFFLLGVGPLQGRLFTSEDEKVDANPTILISEAFWRREFGGDPTVIGRTLELDAPSPALSMFSEGGSGRQSYAIIGILPERFRLTGVGMDTGPVPDAWLPLRPSAHGFNVNAPDFGAIGRLKRGIALGEAEKITGRILTSVMDRGFSASVGMDEEGAHIINRRAEEIGDVRTPLLILFGASGVLLLIAFANVTTLFLGEATVRRHEIALRAAIGATGLRIARQLITEGALLAMASAVCGSLIAVSAIRAVVQWMPGVPHIDEVGLDLRVLLFALAISLLMGVLFGITPAFASERSGLMEVLKESGSKQSSHRRRWAGCLTIAEVALSFVLLVAAGLLTRSLLQINAVNPGVRPANLLAVQFRLNEQRYAERAQRAVFYNELTRRMKSLPGVEDVSETGAAPFIDFRSVTALEVENKTGVLSDRALVETRSVLPNYFEVIGTRILAGRAFTEADVPPSPDGDPPARAQVAIVSRSMARRFWGTENVLGKRIHYGQRLPKGFWLTIVGVAEDVQFFGLSNGAVDLFYVPVLVPDSLMTVLVRTRTDPTTLASAVRNEIGGIDKDLPIDRLKTMDNLISSSTATERYRTILIVAFAMTAGVLTLAGLYGVLSRFVTYRTHELAIRMALGARASNLAWMVLRQSMILTGAGIAIGLVVGLASAHLLSDLLFGISPTDFATYFGIASTLGLVALLASYIPSRRAVHTDPMRVLRTE